MSNDKPHCLVLGSALLAMIMKDVTTSMSKTCCLIVDNVKLANIDLAGDTEAVKAYSQLRPSNEREGV